MQKRVRNPDRRLAPSRVNLQDYQGPRVLDIMFRRSRFDETESVVSAELSRTRGLLVDGRQSEALSPWNLPLDRDEAVRARSYVSLVSDRDIARVTRESDYTLTAIETGRDLLVTGLNVNNLAGVRLQIGSLLLEGVEPCVGEDYAGLDDSPARVEALRQVGGFRAKVLLGGTVQVGDQINIPR